MQIIDTHCHAGHNWFEPVETLLHEMNTNDVDHAVLIQHAGTYDNDYLFECAERFPGRFCVAVQVDPEDPNPEATLERLAERGAAGIRLDASSTQPEPGRAALWRKAGELGLAVSIGGNVDGFA
ncbi:MAG: amidohydrolase family protein, partial [Chloroflexota bacterium]